MPPDVDSDKSETVLKPALNDRSATITYTAQYTVINGSHIQILNGYFYKKNSVVSVETKDILLIERQKLRPKRLLVAGLVLFGLLTFAFGIFGYVDRVRSAQSTLEAALSGDEYATLQLIIGFYGSELFRDDIIKEFGEDALYIIEAAGYSLDAYGKYQKFEEIASGSFLPDDLYGIVKYMIYSVLFIPSALCVGMYTVKPLALLRVKAMGGDFAVEAKHYDNVDIERLLGTYYKRGAEAVSSPPDVTQQVIYCPKCGVQNKATSTFCTACGQMIKANQVI